MKNLAKLLLIIASYTVSLCAYSQVLTTKKGAPLYMAADMRINENYISPGTPSTILRKNKKLTYKGCTHISKSFYYDAYFVSYDGSTYIVPASYVVEDDILLQENNKLDSLKKEIEGKIQEYQKYYDDERFNKFLIRKNERIESLSNKLDSVSSIMAKVEEQADSFAESMYATLLNDSEKFLRAFPQRLKGLCERIDITKNFLHSPNSAGGCDYSFAYVNKSNKTIKYLIWKGVVYNAVEDKIPCTITDSYSFSGRDTGPYSPGYKYCGGTWDCIIYNYDAYKFSLTSINIIYMDGTTYTVSLGKDDYQKILDYYEYLDIESNKNSILSQYKKKRLSELNYDSISKERNELSVKLLSVKNSYYDSEVKEVQNKLNDIKKVYDSFLINGDKKVLNTLKY